MPRGQPQIEVTFNVDVNGILQVSAAERGSGKAEHITIKAERGRLSEEEIERMIAEEEECRDKDLAYAEKVEGRNAFEGYVYSLRTSASEASVQEALTGEDKTALRQAIDAALAWLDENTSASKEEYDARREELDAFASPILQRANGGGIGVGGDALGSGPSVEEVD